MKIRGMFGFEIRKVWEPDSVYWGVVFPDHVAAFWREPELRPHKPNERTQSK